MVVVPPAAVVVVAEGAVDVVGAAVEVEVEEDIDVYSQVVLPYNIILLNY